MAQRYDLDNEGFTTCDELIKIREEMENIKEYDAVPGEERGCVHFPFLKFYRH